MRYKALLDGLNIKLCNYSQILTSTDYFRMEAEYFTANNLTGDNVVSAMNYIARVQYGTSDYLNEEKKGYPVLRLNEFDSFFIKEPTKYCDLINEQQYNELKLHKGDILVCRTNGNPDLVGRAAIVMEESKSAFASYLFRVNVNDKITPELFVTYLQSRYGRIEIDKNSMKGNQTNFSPAKLKDVKIPIFSKEFSLEIKNCFEKAYKSLNIAKQKYTDSQSVLMKQINFDTAQITISAISQKALSESFLDSGRLDAEYYQPKYDYCEQTIKSMKHKKLRELACVQSGEFIEESKYGNQGYFYVRGADITNNTIDFDNATKVDIDINAYKSIDKDELAFAMIGSVGNIAINKKEKCIVSNNLGAIKPFAKKISNYLLLVLSSSIGQLLFEKYQTRTAQPKIRREDVEEFLIPILEDDQINTISQLIEESFALRKESKRLLDLAIKAVETAIETDEETAMQLLKQN